MKAPASYFNRARIENSLKIYEMKQYSKKAKAVLEDRKPESRRGAGQKGRKEKSEN